MESNKIHYAWWIMISCCAIQVGVMGLAAATAGVFFPQVATDLGVAVNQVSLYSTINSLTMMFLYPIAGKILTKYDFRITVSVPVVGLCCGFLILSRVTAIWQFQLMGLYMGTCFSFVMFLVVPLLLNNWFQEKLGSVMGFSMAFSGVGGAISTAAMGFVIQSYGWRLAYVVVAVCLAIIVLPFTLFVIRLHPADKGLLPYGAENASAAAVSHASQIELDGLTRAEAVKTVSYKLVLVFTATMGLLAAMQSAMATYTTSLGLTTSMAGLATSVVSIGIMVSKIGLGVLNDRFGMKRALTVAYIPCFIAVALLFLAGIIGAPALFCGAALYGIAVAITSMEPAMFVRGLFGSKDYSSIYPYVQRAYSLCSAFALPIYTTIYAKTGTFSPVIILLACIMAVSFVCFRNAFSRMGK